MSKLAKCDESPRVRLPSSAFLSHDSSCEFGPNWSSAGFEIMRSSGSSTPGDASGVGGVVDGGPSFEGKRCLFLALAMARA